MSSSRLAKTSASLSNLSFSSSSSAPRRLCPLSSPPNVEPALTTRQLFGTNFNLKVLRMHVEKKSLGRRVLDGRGGAWAPWRVVETRYTVCRGRVDPTSPFIANPLLHCIAGSRLSPRSPPPPPGFWGLKKGWIFLRETSLFHVSLCRNNVLNRTSKPPKKCGFPRAREKKGDWQRGKRRSASHREPS